MIVVLLFLLSCVHDSSSPAGRFPGSTSPLIHGLHGSSSLDSKPVARAGVVGQAPATPQSAALPPTPAPQTAASAAAAEAPANIHGHAGDEYQALQAPDLHNADYSAHEASHADDVNALAANLAHLNTQSQAPPASYDTGSDMAGNVGGGGGYHSHSSYLGMENLASPPNAGLYDPSLGYGPQYDQGGFGQDYNSMGYGGGYDQFGGNMQGFQQRGMGGPSNKGRGFQPQSQRLLGQQPYQNQYRPQQSYQNQIKQQGGGMGQQQKSKYQQPGLQQPGGQGGQQAQQPGGGQQGAQSVGQRGPQGGISGGQSKSPQPTGPVTASPQPPAPAAQPSMMDPYTRVGVPSQYGNNKPMGGQQYGGGGGGSGGAGGQPMPPQGQYGAPKPAPHSPQSSYPKASAGYGGPKGQYQKQGGQPQQPAHQPYPHQHQHQPYQASLPPGGYPSFSPLQFPYYSAGPYGYPAAQYSVNVPPGPPGFNAGRGAPYGAPGPSAFGGAPSPFHASGYSSPQGFDEYNNINEGYNKPHYPPHGQPVDPSADPSIPAQSATGSETGAWQQAAPAAAPKKAVGPESDPAAQRIGAYQNLSGFQHQPPAHSQYSAPNHSHHFNGPSQPQHLQYSSMHQPQQQPHHYDSQRHQPLQQPPPPQHYQQWQPSM